MSGAKKKIQACIKLQIPAGKANPAPPVGSVLGPYGINIMDFCKQFNAKTQKMGDTIIPVVISIYQNRSFSFITKTPPTSVLIKQETGIKQGSKMPQKDKVGELTEVQVEKIAKTKLPDLNGLSLDSAKAQVRGTAKSMGFRVQEGVS